MKTTAFAAGFIAGVTGKGHGGVAHVTGTYAGVTAYMAGWGKGWLVWTTTGGAK